MGVGLVVTLDVVNLPLTLFGEGEDVKMRLSFNLLCAFYLPSNFLKKFHLLSQFPSLLLPFTITAGAGKTAAVAAEAELHRLVVELKW